MRLSGIIGLAGTIALLVLVLIMSGEPVLFMNIPSVIFVVGVSFGIGLASFGLRDMLKAGSSILILLNNKKGDALTQRDADVLRSLITPTHTAGAIGTLLGMVSMLASLDDPAQIGEGIGLSLLCVFYAVLIAEGLLRPAANRIEFLLGETASEDA